jgi:hypothetical protein
VSRYVLLALGLLVLMFGAGFFLRRAVFGADESELPLVAPRAAQSGAGALTVSKLQGRVELREEDGEGWQPLVANARVPERSKVRTEDGASAVLSGNDGLQVEVSPLTQVELRAVERDLAKLVLERGRVTARVGAGSGGLQVGAAGSDALVQARDKAAFSLLRDDYGKLALAVTDGDAVLSAQQQSVRVGAGEQSIVSAGKPPSPPVHIPTSLFLKVAHLGPSRLNKRSTELNGQASPGAAVFVNGVSAATDDDGRFAVRVPLAEGKNELHVLAQDALGRSQRQELPAVLVDTEPPKLQGKTVW